MVTKRDDNRRPTDRPTDRVNIEHSLIVSREVLILTLSIFNRYRNVFPGTHCQQG